MMGWPGFFPKTARYRIIFVVLGVILIGGLSWAVLSYKSASPVPAAIQKAVSFPVYYPAPGRLPAGYTLDSSSFRQAQAGVVIYSINHQGGQPLIVSEEDQPAGSVISDFIKSYTPLHTTQNTSLGQAQIGAYGQPPNLRTVASLPINNGPWLIITSPTDVNQTDLKQILQSLKR